MTPPKLRALGVSKHVARLKDNGDGTFELGLRLNGAHHSALRGHGNTPRDAAKHLADQLRYIAQLVEAQEGTP